MGNGIDLENFCVLSLPWGMLITINFVSLLKLTVKKMYFLYKLFLLSLTVMMFGFTRK